MSMRNSYVMYMSTVDEPFFLKGWLHMTSGHRILFNLC
jgi:hypothetical protein